MSEQPLPLPEISPLPWAIDPDDREGMEWNVHIVERDRPYMRVCFMSNCSQAEINAAFIVKTVNSHASLVKALEKIASESTEWDWDTNDGPNALVKILLQMRAEAREAINGVVGNAGASND